MPRLLVIFLFNLQNFDKNFKVFTENIFLHFGRVLKILFGRVKLVAIFNMEMTKINKKKERKKRREEMKEKDV